MKRYGRSIAAGLVFACLSVPVAMPNLALAAAHASLGASALAAVSRLGLMTVSGTSGARVTRAQAVAGVVAVLGLSTPAAAAPAYTDVPASASDFGAIEAAVNAGLMAGWAPTSGQFDPTANMTRVQLSVFATDAMRLQRKADGLIADLTTFARLGDLSDAGYDLGDVNVALEEGVVPPVSATRFAPNAPVTQETLAVALYRLYLAMDVPATATLTPAAANVLLNAKDALTLSVANRLGQPLSAAALERYAPTYGLQGSNASTASVVAAVFQASTEGSYTVWASLRGPFLTTPITTQTDIQVDMPAPPPPQTPTSLQATEVRGGVALSWTGTGSLTDYQVYEAANGSATYTPVSQTDGGSVPPSATGTTISGLAAGDTYSFEVASTGASGQLVSAPSGAVAFGVQATEQSLSGYASGTIAVNAVDPGAAASITLTVPATTGSPMSLGLYFFQTFMYSVPQGSTPATICTNLPSSWTAYVTCGTITATSLTLLAPSAGFLGNDLTVDTSDPGQISVDGAGGTATIASFTGGGVGADTIAVGSRTYIAVGPAYGNIASDTYTGATSLENSLYGPYDVHLSGSTVTLATKTPGTSGNAIALATDNPSDVVLNGSAQRTATLSGGTAGSLTLSFTNAMDTATISNANLSTALVLSSESATFGSGATATWTNDRTLTIDFGSSATVAPGEAVTFASSVTDAAGNPVTGSVTLTLP